MDTIDNDRRKWLGFGAAALGLALLPNHAFASLTTPRPKILRFENLNTGEFLKAEFFDGKRYNRSELARLNKLFRDHRSNKVKTIDPHLFDQMYLLQVMMNINNELRRTTSGVAKKSYHTRGQAMDFRIPGIQLSQVRKAAMKMRAGGVGYYPSSNFVHMDTGPVRTW